MHASFRARPMAPSRGDSPTVGREGAPTANPSAAFLKLLADEDLTGRTVLDVGTGRGRLALALAPRSGRVVGIGLDAEAGEYGGLEPDAVVAHLCMSSAIAERAGRALTRGAPFAFVAFHADQ